MKTLEDQIRDPLRKDFARPYVREFTTGWREQRMIRGIEIDIMTFDNLMKLIESLQTRAKT